MTTNRAAHPSAHPSTHPSTQLSSGTLLMNLEEVADELRCTRRNVERLVAADQLPVVRFGRSVRIERTAVEVFVAEHRETSQLQHSHQKAG